MLRAVVRFNVALSSWIEGTLPLGLRTDGNRDFQRNVLPLALVPGATVYDVGGGSRPFVTIGEKRRLSLTVVGLDISAEELAAAPEGVFDRAIAADLCTFTGQGDADFVVCQATLEHVHDTSGAVSAIASCLKPGGRALLFAPCRNAVFARINLALPEGMKKRILFALFPHKAEGHDGFKAYYDRCTPRELERLASSNGLIVVQRRLFWTSSYFKAFAPVFVLWRLAQGVLWLAIRAQAAETFWYVLEKPSSKPRQGEHPRLRAGAPVPSP